MLHATPASDFYSLLQVPRDASPNDIKIAYHHTLLRLHPDKQSRPRNHSSTTPVALDGTTADPTQRRPPPPPPGEASVDMALLKEAYTTLSDVGLRAAYDGKLLRREKEHEHARTRARGPRPAQVVSLEEFTAIEAVATETEIGSDTGTGTEGSDAAQEWRHRCRCGGMYRITEEDLENGTHLVGCESCSEVIWVGYEVVISEDSRDGWSDAVDARIALDGGDVMDSDTEHI